VADWRGAEYRRLSRLQDAVAAEALAAVQLRGDEAVLDLGCGDGRRTADLAARVPHGHVLGFDASPLMIEAAAPLRRQGLDFACMRAQELAAVAEFDVVVSLNALHWVPRDELPDVFRRISRSLRDRGRVVVQLVGGSERISLEDVAMRVAYSARWADRFTGFAAPFTHPSPDDIAGWAANAGLAVAGINVEHHVWAFPSQQDFVDWAAVGFGDWTDRLADGEEKLEFVRDVVTSYCRTTGSATDFSFVQLRAVLTAEP
jgi:trans-aconitate 2-methyltransferase